MGAREELEELRRIDELERKAAGASAAPKVPVAPKAPAVKGDDYGDTKGGVLTQALGGAKHAWDKAALALESMVPGGKALSQTLGQPDLKKLSAQGKKYVEETGPASSVGEFAGEVLLTAAPATRAMQLANVTKSVAPQFLKRTRALLVPGAAGGAAGAATMGEDIGTGAAIGAAAGPVLTGAGKLANWTSKEIQNMFGGAAGRSMKELQEMFGDRLPEAINAVRSLRGYLPGEAPTVGKAASANLPEFKVLEEGAKARPGADRFLSREANDQALRTGAMDEMAHPGQRYFDPQTRTTGLSEAEVARATAVDPIMARAAPQRVGLTPELEALMAGPEASAALRAGGRSFQQGELNAAGRGQPFPPGRTDAVPPAPARDVFPGEGAQFGQPYRAQDPFMPIPASASIDELWRVRKSIDAQISRLRNSTDEGAELKLSQLQDARRQLTEAMGQSGEFNVANTVFRNMSAPQNQADIAATLRNALTSPAGVERSSSFLTALRNAPQTIKKSDLSPRFQNIGEVMTPEQMSTINNISKSLRRESDYAQLNAPPGIVPEFLSPMEKIAQKVPGLFDQTITATKKALMYLGNRSDEEVQRIIDDALLDPAKMTRLLEEVPPEMRSGAINKMRELLSNPAALGAAVGTAGAQQ